MQFQLDAEHLAALKDEIIEGQRLAVDEVGRVLVWGLGMLYATTGQREQARRELTTAIEMYRSMEMTFWLPETEAALAQVEGR